MAEPVALPSAPAEPARPARPLLEGMTIDGSNVTYHLNPELRRLHVRELDFWVRYPSDVDLGALPREIVMLPVAYHLAPLAWAFDEHYSVPVVDERAVTSMRDIRAYLRRIYPRLPWSGELSVEQTALVEPPSKAAFDAAALFTAGVDSTYTVLAHDDERLLMITIWGDRTGEGEPNAAHLAWYDEARAFAERLGNSIVRIETNMWSIIDRVRVADALSRKQPIESWWAGIHFGTALTSLVAPVIHHHGIPLLYIAAGATADRMFVKGLPADAPPPDEVTAASPHIDNAITLGPARVSHDGHRVPRQDKVHAIVSHPSLATGDGFRLRVCSKVQHETRSNCGRCEKCLRTMASILVAGGDPRRFGFPQYGPHSLETIRRRFDRGKVVLSESRMTIWKATQMRAAESRPQGRDETEGDFLRWISDYDFEAYWRAHGARPRRLPALARRLGLAATLLTLRRRFRFAVARRRARAED